MTTARMTLKQLRVRWGAHVPPGPAPLSVEVTGMSSEVWLRHDDGTKGEEQTYVLEREYRGDVGGAA